MPPTIKNNWHTIERGDPDVVTALDACEAGDPRAYQMLVGFPCTECYTNDRYPATITHATPSLNTITVARLKEFPNGMQHIDPNRAREYARPWQMLPSPSVVYSYSEIDRSTYRWSDKKQGFYSAGKRLFIGVAELYRPREA